MARAPVTHSVRKAPLLTPYVVVWATFGVLSLGYLSILTLAPQWLDDLTPSNFAGGAEGNRGQRAAARLAADLEMLRRKVDGLEQELAALTEQSSQRSARATLLEEKIASLQDQISNAGSDTNGRADIAGRARASIAKTADNSKLIEAPVRRPAPAKASALPEVSAAPSKRSAVVPRVINTGKPVAPKKVETGSVAETTPAQPDISFGPAVVTRSTPQGVKVSSGESVDSLRLSWSLLTERHGAELGRLQPRYTINTQTPTPSFDLVAGPVATPADAERICNQLRGRGLTCSVGEFAGNAL